MMMKLLFFGSGRHRLLNLSIVLLLAAIIFPTIQGDQHELASSAHKSLLIAAGCFWCAEQAFEQYAPGVVEVVSGYAGGENDFPTYKNHPGHYEVILIEYDPNRTSYELLLQYAWRNIDPFDAYGQFCDKGFSYQPALFYANEEEKMIAEQVRADVLDLYPDWDNESVVVPLLERPFFWRAENYHQDYYIKNPWNYGYYKERCGRTKRLKAVWGEEEYFCYHDLELSCFNDTAVNENGVSVEAVVNIKNAPKESDKVRGAPVWGIIVAVLLAVGFLCLVMVGFITTCKTKKTASEEENEETVADKEADAAAIDIS